MPSLPLSPASLLDATFLNLRVAMTFSQDLLPSLGRAAPSTIRNLCLVFVVGALVGLPTARTPLGRWFGPASDNAIHNGGSA